MHRAMTPEIPAARLLSVQCVDQQSNGDGDRA